MRHWVIVPCFLLVGCAAADDAESPITQSVSDETFDLHPDAAALMPKTFAEDPGQACVDPTTAQTFKDLMLEMVDERVEASSSTIAADLSNFDAASRVEIEATRRGVPLLEFEGISVEDWNAISKTVTCSSLVKLPGQTGLSPTLKFTVQETVDGENQNVGIDGENFTRAVHYLVRHKSK